MFSGNISGYKLDGRTAWTGRHEPLWISDLDKRRRFQHTNIHRQRRPRGLSSAVQRKYRLACVVCAEGSLGANLDPWIPAGCPARAEPNRAERIGVRLDKIAAWLSSMDGQYTPWLCAVRKVRRVLGKSSNDVTARLDYFVEIVCLGIASGYGNL